MSAPSAGLPAQNAPAAIPDSEAGLLRRDGVLMRLANDKLALVAAILLALFALAALCAPLIAPFDPYFTDLSKSMAPPDAVNWFGTDNTGRDIFSRVLFGARHAHAKVALL